MSEQARALARRPESFFVMWCLSLLPFRLVLLSIVLYLF